MSGHEHQQHRDQAAQVTVVLSESQAGGLMIDASISPHFPSKDQAPKATERPEVMLESQFVLYSCVICP